MFVSDRGHRSLIVRSAIALVAVLFAAWLIALFTGASGFGGLPGLADKDDPRFEPADPVAKDGDASAAAEGESATSASQATDPVAGQGSGPSRRTTQTGGSIAPAPGTTSPGTDPTTHGAPDLTPGGNVPGANANGGNGNAYGGGQGGGRTNSG